LYVPRSWSEHRLGTGQTRQRERNSEKGAGGSIQAIGLQITSLDISPHD
jgi:hypothetical protein